MALDQAQEVLTEDIEDHTDVCAIWAFVSEVIEEGDDVRAAGVGVCGGRGGGGVGGCWCDGRCGRSDEALEEFDFVEGCFGVSGCGLDDFECDVPVHYSQKKIKKKKNEHGVSSFVFFYDINLFSSFCWELNLSSFASQTVEKCPQPNFLTTVYLPSENESPMWTGWYPPLT
jgi:hypothetical protein